MIDSLRTIIETYLSIAGSDLTPNTQFSSLAIGYSLAMNLEDLSHIGVKATRQKPVSSVPNQVNHPDTQGQSIGECLCSFFNWSDVNGLTSGISAISLATKMPIELLDMGLLVHIVELIACDITFHIHCTSTSQDRFSGLILPISWARLLAKRYQTNTVSRNTISLPQFVESIVWLSDELRFGQNVNRLIGEKTTPIKSKTIHVFNQRLCWCISLLLVNSSHPVLFTDPVMTSLIHVAGDRDKYCVSTFESPTERFSQAFDQASYLQILCQAFKREPIVMLSNERDLKSERKTFSGIRVINYSNPMAILKELK
ncbi:hypothetical protein RSOLAG1IB_08476 [Rhizoctonia solani AG-1 IB]|uniref:Uncharacterized protein n=1 Tax=Thanatephorus cucumeris (strain AG1-IB / isolate 7/3/14) TaxID=1108050 RepID=A0A0B7FK29_THACB|nr:hypothetical protein RSOLAG1IB_08476 [Rhizoctonia solani AG-1 IB]